MKFLIVGTGATGGCIGGFLASNGYDVTFIARGAQLEKMRENGLRIKSGLKGDIDIPHIKTYEGEQYSEKVDVIFVCVKSYSLNDITSLLEKASHENTIVIPILNGIAIGDRIFDKFNKAFVLDGCVYIVGYIASPGEIVQMGKVFKVVFGARESQEVPLEKVEAVKAALLSCGIEAVISDNIKRDTFRKFSFISAFATCGVYYNITAKQMQEVDEHRQMFIKLTQEIKSIADAMGLSFQTDIVAANLKTVDSMLPDTTASLQKDLLAGKQTEMDGLVFKVIELAEQYGVSVPNYRMIAEKLGYVPR